MDTNVIYTGPDEVDNWFYNRYYYSGVNSRYWTFQMCINLLQQKHEKPVILETGCQREEEDLGAGMSTSIFAEYISRYGGKLIVVDLNPYHLNRAKQYLTKWPGIDVEFALSDSVAYLKEFRGTCDLVYLDSLDYPIGDQANDIAQQQAAQDHNLSELRAVEKNLKSNSIVLLDDNHFPGGGKPAKAKERLVAQGWTCLIDWQSSLWIRDLG